MPKLLHLTSINEDALCFLDSMEDLIEQDYKHLYRVNVSPKGHSSGERVKQKYIGQLTKSDLTEFYDKFRPDFDLHGFTLDDYFKYAKD